MSAQSFESIILSKATYIPRGASTPTAAATYSFFTSDYQPPSQDRSIDHDMVHNQNGKFKYIYDNGPGFKKWSPFNIHCENSWATMQGTAGAQLANLRSLWEAPGTLGIRTPDGTYTVHWGDSLERSFRVFPKKVGDPTEHIVVVQFEEAS